VKVDGGWKLNGAKAWITNAAVAGLSIAYAQTDKSQGYRGNRLLRHRGRAAGASSATSRSNCMAATRSVVGGFRLADYFAPDEALLQPPGQASRRRWLESMAADLRRRHVAAA